MYDQSHFIVADGRTGKGLFANKAFDVGQVVFHFQGLSLTTDQATQLSKSDQANLLQIGESLHLDLRKEHGAFIGHHCNPNCWVKIVVNNAFLIANRPIAKGEEINFDYSLTSTDTKDSWSMDCSCHRFYCKGLISGFLSMDEKFQKECIEKKIVPTYVLIKNA